MDKLTDLQILGKQIESEVKASNEKLKDILVGADISKATYYKIIRGEDFLSHGWMSLCAYIHFKVVLVKQ